MRFSPKSNIVIIALESTVLLALLVTLAPRIKPALNHVEKTITGAVSASPSEAEKKYIKWVDFGVTSEAMKQAFRYDVDTVQSGIHLDWISLLAYLGARYGGDFSKYKAKDMTALADRLLAGESMDDITADMKYYSYYLEAYTAVLGGLVGTYQVEIPATEAPAWVLEQAANSPSNATSKDSVSDGCVWVTKYGLKAFSPVAKNRRRQKLWLQTPAPGTRYDGAGGNAGHRRGVRLRGSHRLEPVRRLEAGHPEL